MKCSMILPLGLLAVVSLQCTKTGPIDGYQDRPVPAGGQPSGATRKVSTSTSASALMRQVNLKVDMVPKGTHGRKVVRPMKPRYITIHSTQNYTAGADRHALALKRGALRAPKRRGGNRIGYLIWHFTTDDTHAVQHMPTNEQGEHADFNGPGNNYSIGIEMCEERGSNLNATIDRTAKLTAWLMYKHGISINRVVPHYHWPRRGVSKPHKNCPHFLMDNGRPGRKWKAFQNRVNGYYKQLRSQTLASR